MGLPSADAERRRICRYEPAPCPSSFPADLVPHWHFLKLSFKSIQTGFAYLDQQKARKKQTRGRLQAGQWHSGTVAQWHSGVRFTRGRSRHSVEGAVPSAYHSADIAHTPTMSAVWKYASLALLAVVSMALAPHICAMEESWVIGVEQVVGGCIFALVDLSVGNGDERRRCIAWFFVAVSVAVVRAVHPIGSAIGKILYFGHVDFAIPRDICVHSLSIVAVALGRLFCSIHQLLRVFVSILDSVNLLLGCPA